MTPTCRRRRCRGRESGVTVEHGFHEWARSVRRWRTSRRQGRRPWQHRLVPRRRCGRVRGPRVVVGGVEGRCEQIRHVRHPPVSHVEMGSRRQDGRPSRPPATPRRARGRADVVVASRAQSSSGARMSTLPSLSQIHNPRSQWSSPKRWCWSPIHVQGDRSLMVGQSTTINDASVSYQWTRLHKHRRHLVSPCTTIVLGGAPLSMSEGTDTMPEPGTRS